MCHPRLGEDGTVRLLPMMGFVIWRGSMMTGWPGKRGWDGRRGRARRGGVAAGVVVAVRGLHRRLPRALQLLRVGGAARQALLFLFFFLLFLFFHPLLVSCALHRAIVQFGTAPRGIDWLGWHPFAVASSGNPAAPVERESGAAVLWSGLLVCCGLLVLSCLVWSLPVHSEVWFEVGLVGVC